MKSQGRVMGSLFAAMLLIAGCYDSSDSLLGGDSHFLQCTERAECSSLGPDYACIDGVCRSESDGAQNGEPSAMGQSADPSAEELALQKLSLPDETPLVMLLVDTSGSMERRASCDCVTPSCEECLPDCEAGEQNRWTNVLATLTGTFEDFSCETLARTEANGATYDFDYYLPYNEPSGVQRADGVLDQFADRLRFGLATFDSFDTWLGQPSLVDFDDFDFEASEGRDGMWSYDPEREIPGLETERPFRLGSFLYPNAVTEMLMDTGIRSTRAESGALQWASGANAGATNAEIQASLLAVRPYGSTPIAAALDDLYYLMDRDPAFTPERASVAPRHVVLITDGYPDPDWRQFGCDCADGDGPEATCVGQDPSTMHCAYPTSERAALTLRCGQGTSSCSGPVAQLHIISFAVDDEEARLALDQIAVAGGGQAAHLAQDALQLRAELSAILSEIAGD